MIQFTQPDAASFSVFISPDRSTDHHQLTLTQHLKAVPLWKAHSWTRYRTQNVEGTQLDTLQNAACGGHTAGHVTECSMWRAHSWTRYRMQRVEGTQLETIQNAACLHKGFTFKAMHLLMMMFLCPEKGNGHHSTVAYCSTERGLQISLKKTNCVK